MFVASMLMARWTDLIGLQLSKDEMTLVPVDQGRNTKSVAYQFLIDQIIPGKWHVPTPPDELEKRLNGQHNHPKQVNGQAVDHSEVYRSSTGDPIGHFGASRLL